MRNGNKKIRVSRIYKRFILSFAIVLLLPVGCFTFIFLQNYREIYREKVLGLAESSLEASVLELERTIESLENFVSYNLMSGSLSEKMLRKDYSAVEAGNILSAELMAEPVLEGISYYNANIPNTIYTESGTLEPKYYAQVYMSMENGEVLLEELTNPENTGWMVWNRADNAEENGVPALWYVVRSWANECWIFDISEKQLEKIIHTENAITVLQDGKGLRLYPPLGREETSNEFIGDMEGYCEITAVSSDGSFMLTRYMEEAYLFAEVHAWQNTFFIIFMAVLVVGGVLILVLTTINEHPIRKLWQDWSKKIPNMPENAIGLDALQFAMKSMEDQVAILETKQKKNHLLLQMIYGKECETERFRSKVKENGLFLQAEVFRVIIAVSEMEQETEINKLGVYLDMFTKEGYEFRRIEMSSVGAFIIIVGMTKEADKELEHNLLQIIEYIEQQVNEKISVYVGEKYERMGQIHLSYSEAISCSQNKEETKENDEAKRVIYYHSVQKNIVKFYYPSRELNALYTALVETNLDQASALTEKLVELLKEQKDNRYVSVSLYYDVLNVYYGAQVKLDMDIDASSLEVDLLEMQERLDVVQMILRIRDQFQSYIDSVREKDFEKNRELTINKAAEVYDETGKKEKLDKEEHIISKVLSFIEENRRSCDLSVSMVAYHFDISISNLSHQFKAQVNRTISDYITEKKFAYVRELLLTTDYSVQKIASMTGYSQPASFIRKFRQYYGMTPVEYRNTAGESKKLEEGYESI